MNKEFIPYEQALALKELGFDEPCFGYYGSHQIYFWTVKTAGHYDNDNNALPAPLYQQVFRWFREKHGIQSYIRHEQPDVEPYYDFIIEEDVFDVMKDTYEEAESACIDKLIEIVKQK